MIITCGRDTDNSKFDILGKMVYVQKYSFGNSINAAINHVCIPLLQTILKRDETKQRICSIHFIICIMKCKCRRDRKPGSIGQKVVTKAYPAGAFIADRLNGYICVG